MAQICCSLFAAGALTALPAQTIQITWPADGTLVTSGSTLIITVNANPSAFQSVTVSAACFSSPAPELTQPPYQFNVSIPPDASPGPCAVAVMGTPKTGGSFVSNGIGIRIERPDSPQLLIPTLPSLYFSYVGESMDEGVLGTFPDGSKVLLTNSTHLAYASDTSSVVTVNGQGDVTAVAPGTAIVTITYGNASIGTTSVKVPVNVPYPVTLNPPTMSLYPSQSAQFWATLAIDPSLDQSVTWSISPQLGSIDQTGLYTAPGSVTSRHKVTVTATSVADPRKSASARVWILPRQTDRQRQ